MLARTLRSSVVRPSIFLATMTSTKRTPRISAQTNFCSARDFRRLTGIASPACLLIIKVTLLHEETSSHPVIEPSGSVFPRPRGGSGIVLAAAQVQPVLEGGLPL